ncbi:hypothetical protein IJJ39_02340 [Candidatus Saccharibacteria bacterium]|nr:hypothetical protein [Candidatus Saccharibacteria bacterium]
MANSFKKRGQKFIKKFSKASIKVSEGGKEHIKENIFARVSHIQNVKLLILEWGLLVSALIMLAITQAFWFSGSYAEDVFVSGGTYTEATIGRVNSLNPLFATTNSEKTLSRLMFATLVAMDYSGHEGPGLAESVHASEDGRVWTMKLRDGLVWSDGEPITTDDIMFTLGLIQNPAINTIYDASLNNVDIDELSTGEIRFTLPSSYADFRSALMIPVVPQHILADAPVKTLVEHDFSVNPVTSGAFSYNATQVASMGDEAVYYLSSNPSYYLGQPLLNNFAIHTYENKADIIDAINAGTITATAELSGNDIDKITSLKYDVREIGINSGAYLFFNTTTGAMKNKALRVAVQQGLNMEEIRKNAPGTQAVDYPLLTRQINLTNYPKLPEYNFVQATEKVASVRGTGQIGVNVVTVNSGYLPAVSENIVAQLKELGFEAALTVYEEGQEFVANVVSKRNYDILIYDIQLGSDPDPLPYYHSSQAGAGGLNLSNYRNSLVDDLLIGARETLDTTLRAKKYETFLEYWVQDVPAIGLYQTNATYVYVENSRNFGERVQLVTELDRFVDVSDWAVVKGGKNLTP